MVTLEYCMQTVQKLNLEMVYKFIERTNENTIMTLVARRLEYLIPTRGEIVAREKQLQFLNSVHYQNYEYSRSYISNRSPV